MTSTTSRLDIIKRNTLSTARWKELLSGPEEELVRWVEAAAKIGDAQAQALLGQILLDGRGVKQDTKTAYHFFLLAAKQRHPMAMNMCGRCLEHGWGVDKDMCTAADWYLRSASLGLDWGMYNYANLLARGSGVPLDHEQALNWYRKAAALGHAKSLNLVGRYYEDGITVKPDIDIAFQYYRASAERGDFRGQYSYACMLAERGYIDEAISWMKKIPETATIAFMQKIALILQTSDHPSFRAIAADLLKRAALKQM